MTCRIKAKKLLDEIEKDVGQRRLNTPSWGVFITPILLQNVSQTEANGTKQGGIYLHLSNRNSF